MKMPHTVMALILPVNRDPGKLMSVASHNMTTVVMGMICEDSGMSKTAKR